MALLPVSVAGIISLFVVMPFIVRTVLTKSFHGFHIRLIRDSDASTYTQTISDLSR
jgi:hypothetical protein